MVDNSECYRLKAMPLNFSIRKASVNTIEPRAILARGFTLIEVLVVMVLVAMMLSLAVVSIGDGFQREMRGEAERLQAVLMAAADEAIYNNSSIGIYFSKDGYLLLRHDPVVKGWVAMANRPFTQHRLPENMLIDWTVEGFAKPSDLEGAEYVEIEFEKSDESSSTFGGDSEYSAQDYADLGDTAEGSLAEAVRQKVVDVTPHVYLLSSGEQTAFKVSFQRDFESEVSQLISVVSDGFSMPYIKTEEPKG